MDVKGMKEIIKDFPDTAKIVLSGWDGQKSTFRCVNRCCNTEHQKEVGEVWLSDEGVPLPKKELESIMETTGHWHCGEAMMIVGVSKPDGFDIFGCTLCDHISM